MCGGDYTDPETFRVLAKVLKGARRPLFYLAIPPTVVEAVLEGLAGAGVHTGGRVVLEKPLGHDLGSARRLNERVRGIFADEDVFRIDHFLGKSAALDLLVFRLGNVFLDPVWNRHGVDHVQLTMAEDVGVGDRAGFYDRVGAVRDVVQNHLLQLLTLIAMEPPVDAGARAVREEKSKVLRAMRPLDPSQLVRGQYEGYRDEPGVAADSGTETFVALRAFVDSWRWEGVPFYVRTGKRLAATATEILVVFRRPPHRYFLREGAAPPQPNHLRLRMKPGEHLALGLAAKAPGDGLHTQPVELALNRDGADEPAYTRLVGEALAGDQTLFAGAEAVEAAWRVVEPALEAPGELHPYEPGSWGPTAAEALLDDRGGWRHPVVGGS
jgi:glucose-6-phosphate 1-dehydrogenase